MIFFFFNDTATTEIYTLSLHDALPISWRSCLVSGDNPVLSGSRHGQASLPHFTRWVDGRTGRASGVNPALSGSREPRDRKSTRLNSSHANISYAVFCLKKKKQRFIYTN